ncbi:protein FAM167B isoform X1 [Argonauta hians]
MDVVHSNPLQKSMMDELILSSNTVDFNSEKYAPLPTSFIDRPHPCFVSSSKDINYNTSDVILECNTKHHSMNQNTTINDLCSDMAQLKATTSRLNLTTKRPSYIAWQAKVLEGPTILKHMANTACLSKDKRIWITNNLQCITEELADMRSQDQHLARQLLCIRQDIQRIKLDKSCEVHQHMLADVQLEMEELEELAEICDLLPHDSELYDNPLRHIGITRMNICRRRFSTC